MKNRKEEEFGNKWRETWINKECVVKQLPDSGKTNLTNEKNEGLKWDWREEYYKKEFENK